MEYKAGQIYRSEKHGSTITVLEVQSIGFDRVAVTFKIEMPKENWIQETKWNGAVLTDFIKHNEYSLVA